MNNQKDLDNKPFIILLVEDNLDDVMLTKRALNEGKFVHQLHITSDGEETMQFLTKIGNYKDAPIPDIILLDLNLPKKSGCDILAEIKNDPDLKHIPVVVLTISNTDKDILKSYELHANCYITKPIEFEDFIENIKLIEDFWLSIVKLPRL